MGSALSREGKNEKAVAAPAEGTPCHEMLITYGIGATLFCKEWVKYTQNEVSDQWPKNGTFDLPVIQHLELILIKKKVRPAQYDAIRMWRQEAMRRHAAQEKADQKRKRRGDREKARLFEVKEAAEKCLTRDRASLIREKGGMYPNLKETGNKVDEENEDEWCLEPPPRYTGERPAPPGDAVVPDAPPAPVVPAVLVFPPPPYNVDGVGAAVVPPVIVEEIARATMDLDQPEVAEGRITRSRSVPSMERQAQIEVLVKGLRRDGFTDEIEDHMKKLSPLEFKYMVTQFADYVYMWLDGLQSLLSRKELDRAWNSFENATAREDLWERAKALCREVQRLEMDQAHIDRYVKAQAIANEAQMKEGRNVGKGKWEKERKDDGEKSSEKWLNVFVELTWPEQAGWILAICNEWEEKEKQAGLNVGEAERFDARALIRGEEKKQEMETRRALKDTYLVVRAGYAATVRMLRENRPDGASKLVTEGSMPVTPVEKEVEVGVGEKQYVLIDKKTGQYVVYDEVTGKQHPLRECSPQMVTPAEGGDARMTRLYVYSPMSRAELKDIQKSTPDPRLDPAGFYRELTAIFRTGMYTFTDVDVIMKAVTPQEVWDPFRAVDDVPKGITWAEWTTAEVERDPTALLTEGQKAVGLTILTALKHTLPEVDINVDKYKAVVQGPTEEVGDYFLRFEVAFKAHSGQDITTKAGKHFFADGFVQGLRTGIGSALITAESTWQASEPAVILEMAKYYGRIEKKELEGKKKAKEELKTKVLMQQLAQGRSEGRGREAAGTGYRSMPPQVQQKGQGTVAAGSAQYVRPAMDQCAFCKQKGHWKIDCPMLKGRMRGVDVPLTDAGPPGGKPKFDNPNGNVFTGARPQMLVGGGDCEYDEGKDLILFSDASACLK